MATMLTHPIIPLVLSYGLGKDLVSTRLLVVACIASVLPDADVIAFQFGIPYASDYGHRGFTHSISFAVLVGVLGLLCHRLLKCSRWICFSVLFIATVSHGMLDALTNGGLGIAFYWPWDSARYFLPWQPVEVSPIGISRFISSRGLAVIKSEVLWIWLPTLMMLVLIFIGRCWLQRSVIVKE